MEAMGIPIVNCMLGTVTKGLVQGLEDLEIRGRMEKPSVKVNMKNSQVVKYFKSEMNELFKKYTHTHTRTKKKQRNLSEAHYERHGLAINVDKFLKKVFSF